MKNSILFLYQKKMSLDTESEPILGKELSSKKALLIGINYKGKPASLRGCINDVHNVKRMLLNKGFKEEDITILTDDTQVRPLRSNIVQEFKKLCTSGVKQLYFHYSGHGTQVPDRNHDEVDGKDEAICPLDYRAAGFITDDEIRNYLNLVPQGTKMFCVFDCCHSGTVCDLGYNIVERKGKLIFARDNKHPDTKAEIVVLSGCLDNQVSADAFLNGQGQGALTYAFLFAIEHAKVDQYNELYRKVHKVMKMCKFRQFPHLSVGTHIPVVTKIYL